MLTTEFAAAKGASIHADEGPRGAAVRMRGEYPVPARQAAAVTKRDILEYRF